MTVLLEKMSQQQQQKQHFFEYLKLMYICGAQILVSNTLFEWKEKKLNWGLNASFGAHI